jgi:hypothetical protein
LVLRAVSSERISHGKVSQTRLDLVAVWREAGAFSSREIAALEWTEALTRVTSAGVTNECYQNSAKEFNESKLAFLTAAIRLDQWIEQDRDGLSLHTSDTTRLSGGVGRNVLARAIFFAMASDNFCSSPLMVHFIFFERSHGITPCFPCYYRTRLVRRFSARPAVPHSAFG